MERVLGRSIRILVVEDDLDTARALYLLLTRAGHTVKTASTASAAISAGLSEHFDLLLCDFGLPDGTGADVLRKITSERPIKGVAVSGFGMDTDIQKSLEAGFSEHLTKPVDFETLHIAIKRTLLN